MLYLTLRCSSAIQIIRNSYPRSTSHPQATRSSEACSPISECFGALAFGIRSISASPLPPWKVASRSQS